MRSAILFSIAVVIIYAFGAGRWYSRKTEFALALSAGILLRLILTLWEPPKNVHFIKNFKRKG